MRSEDSAMIPEKRGTWGQGELYELLVLMVVGACAWFIGVGLGVFDGVSRFVMRHNLMNLVMLTGCLGVGAVVATVRKSILLRKAIAARMAAEALAEMTARHDSLTGLPNRRLFHETLEAALARCTPDDGFAVLLIDLDRFKPVNDVHGHAAGNAVLCAVADRLRELMPPGGVAARLGGDEFVALVPYHEDRDALVGLVQQIIAAVREPVPWNHGQVEVDSTIGVAFATPEDHDPDALLHAADVAMYQGKREGRGTFRFFHTEMDIALKARARLESDLRAAITRGEIKPSYQPIVSLPDAGSRRLRGARALGQPGARLGPDGRLHSRGRRDGNDRRPLQRNPAPGLLRRAKLARASATGGQHIGDSAARSAVVRHASGHAHRDGLSAGTPRGRDHRDRAAQRPWGGAPRSRRRCRISASRLRSTISARAIPASSICDDLRFSKIKIDKSYVANLEQGSERAKLVDAIIQIGASLSLQTTAEGIENDASLNCLSNHGCDFAQGFLFGSAMSKDEADKFIQSGKAAPSSPEARAA